MFIFLILSVNYSIFSVNFQDAKQTSLSGKDSGG